MSLLALVDAIHAGRAQCDQANGDPASENERPGPSEVVRTTWSGSAAVRVLPAISASRQASALTEARMAATHFVAQATGRAPSALQRSAGREGFFPCGR